MESERSLYGIIGFPLAHSLSPVMHNRAFDLLEVDARYELFPLEDFQLQPFFEELKRDDNPIFGLNVTVPYKESVLTYMDSLSPLVEKIGAVNTIVVGKDRQLTAYNTDAPGFLAHLSELNVETADQQIAVLGAGGSARAIIAALCLLPERPREIRVYNRTADRLASLIESLAQKINVDIVKPVADIEELDIRSTGLLVNTTSVGLREDDPSLVEEYDLHSDIFVYDLIYNPPQTPLLQMAEDAGARTANGLGMLFYQGVLALQHWAGMEIPEEIKIEMREALEGAIQTKN